MQKKILSSAAVSYTASTATSIPAELRQHYQIVIILLIVAETNVNIPNNNVSAA